MAKFSNPYRPGAGHMPRFLAGRDRERDEFHKLLEQTVIFENLILTGLRGVGKTVLLETFKPLALQAGWKWVGTDLSESSSQSEERVATRLLTDLAVVSSSLVAARDVRRTFGFRPQKREVEVRLDYETLGRVYAATPGLAADKLKAVLELVWACLKREDGRGIVFAYDEAQNMSDHAQQSEYPLSLMLDVFQSVQKKEIPFLLVLVGLPTLFPRLVEARTFSERMFHVMTLDRLNKKDSREAILKPISDKRCPVKFSARAIDSIVAHSGGYPYFIQFICREAYDARLQQPRRAAIQIGEIVRKLDSDFFMGRWSRATDRQQQLLWAIAHLENRESEFTVQQASEISKELLDKGLSPSHVNQVFRALAETGLVYKNRHGKYSFAVPLLGEFIRRQFG